MTARINAAIYHALFIYGKSDHIPVPAGSFLKLLIGMLAMENHTALSKAVSQLILQSDIFRLLVLGQPVSGNAAGKAMDNDVLIRVQIEI
jgi:hypothetical protein